MSRIKIYTIGFTKKSAEDFFRLLRGSGVKRIVDVRLNTTSQLSGYAKKDDLAFFAREVGKVDYVHRLELAPTPELLAGYRSGAIDWDSYAQQFLALMKERRIEERIPHALMAGACLLCSEDQPHRCHRTLVAKYLCERWGDGEVEHLV